MKKAKLFLGFLMFLIILVGCVKQYTIDDIVNQKGVSITRIEERTVDIAFNKVMTPTNIGEKKYFEKDEVLAFRTESSHIYLESIEYNEDNPEYLIFRFNMSYIIDKSRYVTVPYKLDINNNDISYTAGLKFTFIDDGYELYDNALYMYENGVDEKFVVAIKKEDYDKAQGIISFTMEGFYDLTFIEE